MESSMRLVVGIVSPSGRTEVKDPVHGMRLTGTDRSGRTQPLQGGSDKIVLTLELPNAALERMAVYVVERSTKAIMPKKNASEGESVALFDLKVSPKKATEGPGVFVDASQASFRLMTITPEGELVLEQIGVAGQDGDAYLVHQETYRVNVYRGDREFRCPVLEPSEEPGRNGNPELLEFLDERFSALLPSLEKFDEAKHAFVEETAESFCGPLPSGQGRVRWWNAVSGTGAADVRTPDGKVEEVKLFHKNIEGKRGELKGFKRGDVITFEKLRPVNSAKVTSFAHEAIGLRLANK